MNKIINSFNLMKSLSNGFIPFLVTAILLPILALVALGIYFIFINGYIIYFIFFILFLSILYFGMNFINTKYRKETLKDEKEIIIPENWSDNDKEAFEILKKEIEDKFKKDVEWGELKEFSFLIISKSASSYKSKSWGDKEFSFSISELLMAIEELSHRYRGYIKDYIPFENQIPISILKLGYDNKDKIKNAKNQASKIYDIYRVARLANPWLALISEAKSIIQETSLKGISSTLQNKAKKELMLEVASVSIDLYRGYFKKNQIKVNKMSIKDEIIEIKNKLNKEKQNPIKIALFGQPGAGKSSIINKIVGKEVAKTGVRTDLTVDVQIIEHQGLIFVDLPGYGTSKFPPNEFFDKFNILDYDLFLNVFSGKFHSADSDFFQKIRKRGKVSLLVRNKCDDIWEDGKSKKELYDVIKEDARKHIKSNNEEVIFTDVRKNIGFDKLNEEISKNIDDSKQERFTRGAKAYTLKALEDKREACKMGIHTKAALAAAGNVVPILGAGIAADIGALLLLFKDIRENFGLDENLLQNNNIAKAMPIAKQILEYGTKEGVILLLKQFAGRELGKEIAKFIPFIGSAIAASISFAIIEYTGLKYVDDCYEVAKKMLEDELKDK